MDKPLIGVEASPPRMRLPHSLTKMGDVSSFGIRYPTPFSPCVSLPVPYSVPVLPRRLGSQEAPYGFIQGCVEGVQGETNPSSARRTSLQEIQLA